LVSCTSTASLTPWSSTATSTGIHIESPTPAACRMWGTWSSTGKNGPSWWRAGSRRPGGARAQSLTRPVA
jgi:hypothetical protein